ncbi:MAG: hypothetical protein ACRD2F_09205 [Terriglobales bacterium]
MTGSSTCTARTRIAKSDDRNKKFLVKHEAQPLDRFIHARIENFVALGPVQSVAFHSIERMAQIEICDVRADAAGNFMVVLLDQARGAGTRALLVGGLATIRPRRMG